MIDSLINANYWKLPWPRMPPSEFSKHANIGLIYKRGALDSRVLDIMNIFNIVDVCSIEASFLEINKSPQVYHFLDIKHPIVINHQTNP